MSMKAEYSMRDQNAFIEALGSFFSRYDARALGIEEQMRDNFERFPAPGDGRDFDERRINAATAEPAALERETYEDLIDYRTVSRDGEAATIAHAIYHAYLRAMRL